MFWKERAVSSFVPLDFRFESLMNIITFYSNFENDLHLIKYK